MKKKIYTNVQSLPNIISGTTISSLELSFNSYKFHFTVKIKGFGNKIFYLCTLCFHSLIIDLKLHPIQYLLPVMTGC